MVDKATGAVSSRILVDVFTCASPGLDVTGLNWTTATRLNWTFLDWTGRLDWT